MMKKYGSLKQIKLNWMEKHLRWRPAERTQGFDKYLCDRIFGSRLLFLGRKIHAKTTGRGYGRVTATEAW